MRQSKKTKRQHASRGPKRTIFEQAMDFQSEMRDVCGMEPIPFWKRPPESSPWTKNICIKLRNTILKPLLKLKPKRNKVEWRNYGRMIGILERHKTFLARDLPRILKEKGLDKISKKKWKKILPELGLEKADQYCLKILNHLADDSKLMEQLENELQERRFEHQDKIKETAFFHLATRDAKTNALFLKGFSEGYTAIFNEEGQFSGDDRRLDVYCQLLEMEYEIEKMRRAAPPKSRKNLLDELKKSPNFQDRGQKWFNDVCDEVGLSMKGAGPAYKFATP